MHTKVKLTFLGDIMCKAQMLPSYMDAESDKYNFDKLFEDMIPMFQSADFVFANLETPISFSNKNLTTERFCFNSPYEFAQAAYNAGVNFFATANNHCLDRGVDGISSTIKSLNDIGAYHTGIYDKKDKSSLVVDVNGMKIGILSYTYGTNAFSNNCYLPKSEYWRVNLFQNQELSNGITRYCLANKQKLIPRIYNKFVRTFHPINENRQVYERKEFSRKCSRALLKDINLMKRKHPDIIVMYMHAGGQYNNEVTQDTKKLANYLMKQGVDIVVGSHEHVVHGGDFSNISGGKLATYSLGNFDGIAGVYDEPFDKMAEYSIAWHIYFDKEDKKVKIENSTYSILKSIALENGGIKTVPLYDLINSETDDEVKNELWKDMKKIAFKFSGSDISESGLLNEYNLF